MSFCYRQYVAASKEKIIIHALNSWVFKQESRMVNLIRFWIKTIRNDNRVSFTLK